MFKRKKEDSKKEIRTLEEVQKNAMELEEKIFNSISEILKEELEENKKDYSAHELYVAICYIKKLLEMQVERQFGKEGLKKYQNSFTFIDATDKGTC